MLAALTSVALLFLSGCQSASNSVPLPTEASVDLPRFMGDWYVIAHIPTFIEKEAYNALESYELAEDGVQVNTTFTFNKGSLDGPLKSYHPTGFVSDDTSNAVWRMQFIWPFKADYRIVHLDNAYSETIVGRNKRDYVWIMARSPHITDADYQRLLQLVEQAGYDLAEIRKVPHARGSALGF